MTVLQKIRLSLEKELQIRKKIGKPRALVDGLKRLLPPKPKRFASQNSQQHVEYGIGQNIVSLLAEQFLMQPFLSILRATIVNAEDEYMPSGPPMSPVTNSLYALWSLFDLPCNKGEGSLASLVIGVADFFEIENVSLGAIKNLNKSRMGVYEVKAFQRDIVQIEDIATSEIRNCFITSGFQAKVADLLLMRVVDPLPGFSDSLAMTTPYKLVETPRSDWESFIDRQVAASKLPSRAAAVEKLFRYGAIQNYWLEYVFCAYVNHQHDVIFITGVPDLAATLPHA